MDKSFTFEWVFISWIISLFVHHHGLKRTAIIQNKDNLINLITSLYTFEWVEDYDTPLYLEDVYNTKIANIRWKLIQLNKLASFDLISEKKLDPLYNFDIETYIEQNKDKNKRKIKSKKQKNEQLQFSLQEHCNDIINNIEQAHFDKIATSKTFMLWSARYSLAGILYGLIIVYFYIQIMSFFFE